MAYLLLYHEQEAPMIEPYWIEMVLKTSQKRIALGKTVSTATLAETRESVADVISAWLYEGGDPALATEPLALAAIYSVPDGAPLAMALVNLGGTLTDAQATHFEKMKAPWRRVDQIIRAHGGLR
jgi:hypothetical protein